MTDMPKLSCDLYTVDGRVFVVPKMLPIPVPEEALTLTVGEWIGHMAPAATCATL